jgi:hypothetical protein
LDVLYQQEQENLKNNFIDVSNISKIFPFISEMVSQNIELIGNKQN